MKEKIAIISIFSNIFLALSKLIIGFISMSASVFAEGIHSGMDVLSSIISLIGIKISKKPFDKKHPYGHHKYEVISGLIITIILFITGIWIMYQAYLKFQNPTYVQLNTLTVVIMIISSVINEIMARLKIYYGKLENSLSLISDGVHSRLDVYASLIILIGLFFNKYWIYLDSTLALIVGAYIIKESFELGKEATESLLDVYAGDEIESKIIEIIKSHNIDSSELKTLKKGSAITANIIIKLPNTLTVSETSKITEHLKEDLIKEIENLQYVSIQVDGQNIMNNFFEPKDFVSRVTMGKGFGWNSENQRKRKNKNSKKNTSEGECVCSKCGFKIKHERGIPCSKMVCPTCKKNLKRE